MNKFMRLMLIVCLSTFLVLPAQAQFDKLKKVARDVKQTEQKIDRTQKNLEHKTERVSEQADKVGKKTSHIRKGDTYYVSKTRGSARGEGTKDSPYKDVQKAIDNAKSGDWICIAEGNYLGNLDRGWIEIKNKYVSLEGGWNDDFTERNPIKYITKIQPSNDKLGTINGSNGVLHIWAESNINETIVIDGIHIDLGQAQMYYPASPEEKYGWPGEGVETGRVYEISTMQPTIRGIGGRVAGKFIVRNCCFTNIGFHAIIVMHKGGDWEIYNNVFVSNHYAALDISGGLNQNNDAHKSTVDFHHNTVAFSWVRTKLYEDMGYGYRFRNGVDHSIHHNIFACNSYAGLDAGWDDSNLPKEKRKILDVYDNRFFMNHGDLSLAGSSGGKWIFVKSDRFDEVELLRKYEGNAELGKNSNFVKAIDAPYLKGFAELKIISSQSYDPNSAANLYREAHGMNKRGTETVRVSMHGNRYNFEKAFKFFGAEKDYGAQIDKY